MSKAVEVPAAGDSPMDHADWVELQAIQAADGNSSIRDLVQALRRTGTADTAVDPDAASYRGDAGSEISEAVAEASFAELARRAVACGEDRYPFDVRDNYIQLRPDWEASPYVFLLLLSAFGLDAGDGDPERVFEDVAAAAAASYLGGGAGARSLSFGFPRRYARKGFPDALDNLCNQLGEGGGHRKQPGASQQKDAKLDVVAWRPFRDAKRGQLLLFGQCATGRNWTSKISELQPEDFCRYWMLDPPAVLPAKALFLPRCVPDERWLWANTYGGIVFDRCRIASLIADHQIPADARSWAGNVLSSRI